MFRKYTVLALSLLFAMPVQCEEGPKKLDEVKEKWIKWADSAVLAERDAFLKRYGLDGSNLRFDDKLVEMIRSSIDQGVFLEDALINSSEEITLGPVKTVAAEVFKKCDVRVMHNPDLEVQQVGVAKHYDSNMCYVVLNCEKHLGNLSQLQEVLRHEYSHVLNDDNLNEGLIQYAAWANSTVEREKVEEQTLPYHRAFETRADVYAAVNSPHHGKHLIDFFGATSKGSQVITHPADSERIALLEKIKLELDAAKE